MCVRARTSERPAVGSLVCVVRVDNRPPRFRSFVRPPAKSRVSSRARVCPIARTCVRTYVPTYVHSPSVVFTSLVSRRARAREREENRTAPRALSRADRQRGDEKAASSEEKDGRENCCGNAVCRFPVFLPFRHSHPPPPLSVTRATSLQPRPVSPLSRSLSFSYPVFLRPSPPAVDRARPWRRNAEARAGRKHERVKREKGKKA